jgi:glycerol-3-phosphate dehydrogenase
MAITAEDILARRLRILFLNAATAIRVAPRVAALMAAELNHNDQWIEDQVIEFTPLANQYRINLD